MRKLVLQAFVVTAAMVVTASLGFAKESMTRLADAHADACMWNYNQCMGGCGGASGCEGQCQANYDGCMSQN
jgi:hypothetical protein